MSEPVTEQTPTPPPASRGDIRMYAHECAEGTWVVTLHTNDPLGARLLDAFRRGLLSGTDIAVRLTQYLDSAERCGC